MLSTLVHYRNLSLTIQPFVTLKNVVLIMYIYIWETHLLLHTVFDIYICISNAAPKQNISKNKSPALTQIRRNILGFPTSWLWSELNRMMQTESGKKKETERKGRNAELFVCLMFIVCSSFSVWLCALFFLFVYCVVFSAIVNNIYFRINFKHPLLQITEVSSLWNLPLLLLLLLFCCCWWWWWW